MDVLKLHKSVSKPGLLREVFDSVVEEVCGRVFPMGACLMSGLVVFLEQHDLLLQFDRWMRKRSVGRKCICAICTNQDASERSKRWRRIAIRRTAPAFAFISLTMLSHIRVRRGH